MKRDGKWRMKRTHTHTHIQIQTHDRIYSHREQWRRVEREVEKYRALWGTAAAAASLKELNAREKEQNTLKMNIIAHKQKQQSRYIFRCVFFYCCCCRCCCCNMFSSLVVQLKQSNIGKRKSQSKSQSESTENRFSNILHKLQIDQRFYFQSML